MQCTPATTAHPPARAALWLAAAVAIMLLAAGLRFHDLGAQSLWNDEGASAVMAGRSARDILIHAAADIHPPGYYLALAAWTGLTGTSEFALRAFSALASVLTVATIGALGRRLYDRKAALAAALLLAANGFAIYYGQEARMYALLGLLATAGMGALATWLVEPSRRAPLMALALGNAAGLYTHYAYPFTMLAQGAVFVLWWLRRRDWRPLSLYIAANALTLLLFAPWVGTAIGQVTTWPDSGVGTDPAFLLRTLSFGPGGQDTSWVVAFAALFAAAALWMWRGRALWFLPIVWASVTIGGFLLLGLAADDLKQLTPASAALTLWLGSGLAALWRDRCITPRLLAAAASAILAAALLAGLSALYTDPAYRRNDYRAMASAIMADARPGDAIILDGPGQGEVWSYYYRGTAPVYPLPRDLGGDDAATQAEMTAILRDHRRIFALFWGDRERDPNSTVERALNAGAFEADSRWYGDVRFVVYAVPGEPAAAPAETLNLHFGIAGAPILLEGVALDRETVRAGDALAVTLFWRTDEPLDRRYKVFVHLYANPDAPPPAQHDSEPGGGLAPTTGWTPGETVIDRHGLLIPPDLPPGEYTLAVGLYAVDDPAARLILAGSGGERAEIARITVLP